MSVATKPQAHAKLDSGRLAILGPGGNRVRVLEEKKRKNDTVKKPKSLSKVVSGITESAVRNNVSVDSSCSSDSASSGSLTKIVNSKRTEKHKDLKPVKVAPNGNEASEMPKKLSVPLKRCDWITPNSDPIYISFHDEEWGNPVHDENRLFELLVFSMALAELSWPEILHRRDTFRMAFDNFEPSSIAKFTEKKLLSLKTNGFLLLSEPKLRVIVENAKQVLKVQLEFGSFSNYCWTFVNKKPIRNGFLLLSEPKLRVIVENAKQVLKVQLEFGSFSNYCWTFVNKKPIRNGFRYARQVPAKTPKSDLMSKDLMQRGFRCVGPTAVYSFMQVTGMVNDHLASCFRYHEFNTEINKDSKPKIEELNSLTEVFEKTCFSSIDDQGKPRP